jgi:hypothetical protein
MSSVHLDKLLVYTVCEKSVSGVCGVRDCVIPGYEMHAQWLYLGNDDGSWGHGFP